MSHHSCSLATLAVISVLSQQSCGDEDNTRKQTSSNTEGFLQNAAVALAATYAVASSLSVVPSAPTEKEEASPGTLESIPEINDHPHASSTTEEESKLDAMEYTESVEFDDEEEDVVKRAPLYAVEERNYAKTSWTRSVSMSRAPRARITSSRSLGNLGSANLYEVPDMTACNSLNALSSFSTVSPTRSTSDFFNLKPSTRSASSATTKNGLFPAIKSAATTTGTGTARRSSSSDFFGLRAPVRATTTNRVSTQRNAQWGIME